MNRRNLLRATGSMISLGALGATSAAANQQENRGEPPEGRGYNRDDHPGRGPDGADYQRGEQERDTFVNNGMTIQFDGCSTVHVRGHNDDAQEVIVRYTVGGTANMQRFAANTPQTIEPDTVMIMDVYVMDEAGTDPWASPDSVLVEGSRDPQTHPCGGGLE